MDKTPTALGGNTMTNTVARQERETMRLGPARVRIGFRVKGERRRMYKEVQGGRITTGEVKVPGVDEMAGFMVFTNQKTGAIEYVLGLSLDDVVVVRDWENYYEERIDAEHMPLAEYLAAQEGA